MLDRNRPKPITIEEEQLYYGELLEHYRHTAVNLISIISIEYRMLEEALARSAAGDKPESSDPRLELLLASAVAARGTLDILEEDPDSYKIYMAMCPYKRRDSQGWPTEDLVLEFLSLLIAELRNTENTSAPHSDNWRALRELRLKTLKQARVMYKTLRASLVMTN